MVLNFISLTIVVQVCYILIEKEKPKEKQSVKTHLHKNAKLRISGVVEKGMVPHKCKTSSIALFPNPRGWGGGGSAGADFKLL